MFQITFVISELSNPQRQAIAAFILAFPQSEAKNNNEALPLIGDEERVIIPSFEISSEDDEPTPETAFTAISEVSPAPTGLALVPSPPQAVASAATVAAALPASPTGGADATTQLDKSGLPWDARIHAGSRVTTADGNWRKRRGIDDATVTQVEAELKALMGLPAPVAATPVATVAVPTPPAPAAPVVASAEGRAAFVSLIARASAAINAKTLTQAELESAVVACGVPSLPLLSNRLDLVPQVAATIEAILQGR